MIRRSQFFGECRRCAGQQNKDVRPQDPHQTIYLREVFGWNLSSEIFYGVTLLDLCGFAMRLPHSRLCCQGRQGGVLDSVVMEGRPCFSIRRRGRQNNHLGVKYPKASQNIWRMKYLRVHNFLGSNISKQPKFFWGQIPDWLLFHPGFFPLRCIPEGINPRSGIKPNGVKPECARSQLLRFPPILSGFTPQGERQGVLGTKLT